MHKHKLDIASNASDRYKQYTLQPVIFTEYAVTTHTSMYFRPRGEYQYDASKGTICLERNASISFNTYFNSLNIEKWQRFTHAKNIYLELHLQGKFKIILKSEKYGEDDAQFKVLYFDSSAGHIPSNTHTLENKLAAHNEYPRSSCQFSFEGLTNYPNLYFDIIALSENATIYGGEYFTILENQNFSPIPAKLALILNAEKTDLLNPTLLKTLQDLTTYDDGALSNKIQHFIACKRNFIFDQSTPCAFTVLPYGRYAGPSGVVARGLINILRDKSKTPFTHFMMLEADAEFSQYSLIKLFYFLQLLRTEYQNSSLLFGVFDSIHKNIQQHSGAFWNGAECSPAKTLYDMRSFQPVMANEIMDKVNAGFWHGSCHSLKNVHINSLLLPLFSDASAASFCKNKGAHCITLNGLCLWYSEPRESQEAMEYYGLRDACILAATSGTPIPPTILKKKIWKTVWQHITCMRYSSAELVCAGIEDFCSGPNFLQETNPQMLYQHILKKTQKPIPVDQNTFRFVHKLYERDSKPTKDRIFSSFFRKITFNGLLLPHHGTRILSVAEKRASMFYRLHRTFLYDETTQAGYTLRWNPKKIFSIIKQLIVLNTTINKKYAESCQSYQNRKAYLASLDFWRAYVKISNK